MLDSTISSSILTFAIGILGNTNIKLSEWWHYLLVVFALVGIFIFFSLIFFINGIILTLTAVIMRSISMVFGLYIANKIGKK